MANWGITSDQPTSASPASWTRALGGTSPNMDNMILRSITIRVGTTHSSQVRLAVYTGGSFADGPEGSTLLADLGQTSGSSTNAWLIVNYTGSEIVIPKNTITWIAIKSNGGFSVKYNTSSPTGSNFQTGNGRWSTDDLGYDPSVAFPSTWNDPDTSGSYGNFWYALYLTYTVVTYNGLEFGASSSKYLSSVANFTPPQNCSVSWWLVLFTINHFGRTASLSGNWEIGLSDNAGSPTPNAVVNAMNSGTLLFSSTSLQPYVRYHVVCTATSSARQIYLNGILDNSAASGGTAPTAGTLYVGVQYGGSSYFLDGSVEDLRVYNRIISAEEVATIYACKRIDNITYGLIHRWLMDGPMGVAASGSGSVKDEALNQLNLTPSNSPVYSGTQLKYRRMR